jgi:hypothetical protein
VAIGLKKPVLAIVPGYGVADAVLQGLGGWFGFGVYDLFQTKSHLQNFLAVVAPKGRRRTKLVGVGSRPQNPE